MTKRYLQAFALLTIAAIFGEIRGGLADPLDIDAFEALYETPAPAPSTPLRVFHLGHSLVGPVMPVMLQQLAGREHNFSSQLGWGTPMKAHWEPDVTINGFELRNAAANLSNAREAISSGQYDTVVFTEMVEIRDAIKYFDSAKYLHKWVQLSRASNPQTRVYFYETWHHIDDEEGWLDRLDKDLARYWEKEILRRALAYEDQPQPIYLIPAGQVLAQFAREVEKRGGVGQITDRNSLYSDEIHLNDYGAYLVALTHYAVIYQKSPVGLPHRLMRDDGKRAQSPTPELALLMQEVVWDVVQKNKRTGVPGR